MKIILTALACVGVLCAPGRAQTFPFEDGFGSYGPGATGGPAWSALGGTHFAADDGALQGPVLVRFNLRPPRKYTVEVMVSAPSAGTQQWSAGFRFNGQDDKALLYADVVSFNVNTTAKPATAKLDVLAGPYNRASVPDIAIGEGTVRLRLTVDADSGRFAFSVGDKMVHAGACEYPAGVVAVELGENVSAKHVAFRSPTADETKTLAVTTLFNDPRDIADGGEGTILVLHRGPSAVLRLDAGGTVMGSYGRRLPGSLVDPVAFTTGLVGEVMVLNRFPGEVIVYEQTGGIRWRFGKGRLVSPSAIAVLPNGFIYVADAGAGGVVAFSAAGRYIGVTKAFSGTPTARASLASDGAGNLVLTEEGATSSSVMRPGKGGILSIVREDAPPASDLIVAGDSLVAVFNGAVTPWLRSANDARRFTGVSVGVLGHEGRLARVGDLVYVLDRDHSRVVAVPNNLLDEAPVVTLQNVNGSSALVRWNSQMPDVISRVRVLRGSTWDKVTVTSSKPTTKHQVSLERLQPGRTYRYVVSPLTPTIPAADWSTEYTFQTPGTEVKS